MVVGMGTAQDASTDEPVAKRYDCTKQELARNAACRTETSGEDRAEQRTSHDDSQGFGRRNAPNIAPTNSQIPPQRR